MHELSLCRQLCQELEQQAQQQQFKRISKVELKLGTLSCIEADALQFCFQALSHTELLKGCQLSISPMPADAICLQCHYHYPLFNWLQSCPNCHGMDRDISGGDAMLITDLEVINV